MTSRDELQELEVLATRRFDFLRDHGFTGPRIRRHPNDSILVWQKCPLFIELQLSLSEGHAYLLLGKGAVKPFLEGGYARDGRIVKEHFESMARRLGKPALAEQGVADSLVRGARSGTPLGNHARRVLAEVAHYASALLAVRHELLEDSNETAAKIGQVSLNP